MKRLDMALFVVATLAATMARAQESRIPLRSFDRFEFDTENFQGLWVEAAAAHTDDPDVIDVTTAGPRLAYGLQAAEFGLFVPFHDVNVTRTGLDGKTTREEGGVGDIQLYGRVTPLQTTWVDAGLGLELSLPTGDRDKGLGTGEFGVLPYGMAAAHLGSADLRAHLGYRAFTGSGQRRGRTIVFDSFVYGGGVFVPLGDRIALRAECAAESFDTDPSRDAAFFEPGVDLRVLAGSVDVLLRPTGAIGLTSDTPDWGIGGSIVVAWHNK